MVPGGRRWSQVVRSCCGLVARFTNYGRQTKLILINLIFWWKQGKLTPSASGGKREEEEGQAANRSDYYYDPTARPFASCIEQAHQPPRTLGLLGRTSGCAVWLCSLPFISLAAIGPGLSLRMTSKRATRTKEASREATCMPGIPCNIASSSFLPRPNALYSQRISIAHHC